MGRVTGFTHEQLMTMLEMQERMNEAVNPGWREQKFPFMRAVAMESAEAMDHLGWKWWKMQRFNVPAFEVELVDIMHFLFSAFLQHDQPFRVASEVMRIQQEQAQNRPIPLGGVLCDLDNMDARDLLDSMMMAAFAGQCLTCRLFFALCETIGISFNTLYRTYCGKNVLNHFRQQHGYQDGSYQKIWSGREDNDVMLDLLTYLPADADLPEALARELQEKYSEALTAA